MTTDPEELTEVELIFTRRESTGSMATRCFVGGIAAIGFALAGFCLVLVTQAGQFAMHALTTFPTLVGIAALGAARILSRTPFQVSVGAGGVSIEDRKGKHHHSWDEIGWAAVGDAALGAQKKLTIYDTAGKTIASLSDGFDDFDSLVEEIQAGIARKGDTTAEAIQKRKGRKSALLMASFALGFTALALAVLWMALEDKRKAALLQEAAVPGEAEIVRRFTAPNGVTKRVEYRVAGEGGETGTRNAEVTPVYWDSLEGAATVPVVFVPSEPAVSRLAEGEVESSDFSESPQVMIGLSVVILVMCAVFFGAAVMQWLGWDIDLDSKTGKISIKRFGAGGS